MEDYYTIQTQGHHGTMFAELHTLQKQGVMCDIILAAEDGEVMAHKVVLMAASKYFRDKLSPVMGPTASKICLKGISVVELANLVKYIYTGKLLVAKETMDITLEISEILELNGVVQGYKEIISYEQFTGNTAKEGDVKSQPSSDPSTSGPSAVNKKPEEGSVQQHKNVQLQKNVDQASQGPAQTAVSSVPNVISSSTGTQPAVVDAISSTSVIAQPDSNQGSKVIVTDQSEDDSTVALKADGTRETTDVSTSQYSSDYNFDTLLDQQYMDVSAGSRTPSKTQGINSPQAVVTPPKFQQMTPLSTDSQKIAAERAQHQDLLAVAIETLSDVPHLKQHTSGTQPEVERAVSSISSGETLAVVPHNIFKPDEYGNFEDFENGKTNTKTVTMSAGSVSNDLGGKTDVYTVALDPASIKSPLKMARPKRSKSAKEKEAELKAKMYRLKKAEILLAGTNTDLQVASDQDINLGRGKRQKVALSKQDFQYDSLSKTKKKPFVPRILLNPRNVRKKQGSHKNSEYIIYDEEVIESVFITEPQEIVMDRTLDTETAREEKQDAGADDFGQVVNFDSDDNADDDVDGMIADNLIAALNTEEGKEESTNSKECVTETKESENKIKESPKADYVLKDHLGKEESKNSARDAKSQKDKLPLKTDDNVNELYSVNPSGKDKWEKDNLSEETVANSNEKDKEIASCSSTKELSENEDKEFSDDLQSQLLHFDEAEEKIRSSATKRKTRTPRKLPLSDEEKGNDSGPDRGETIQEGRTRKSSRSLNLEKEKVTETYKISSNTGDTGHCQEPQSNISIDKNFDGVNIDCKNLSKPTEIKIIAQRNVDENALDEAEKQIHESVSKKIIIVPKNFNPEIRLKKRTTEEMLQMAKDIAVGARKLPSDEKKFEMKACTTGEDTEEDNAKTSVDNSNLYSSIDIQTYKDKSKRKNREYEKFSVVKKRKIVGEIIGGKDGTGSRITQKYKGNRPGTSGSYSACVESLKRSMKASAGSPDPKGKAREKEENSSVETGKEKILPSATDIGDLEQDSSMEHVCPEDSLSSLKRHRAMFHDKRASETQTSSKGEKIKKLKDSNNKEDNLPEKPDQTIVKTEAADDLEDTVNREEQWESNQEKTTASDKEDQPECSYCGKTFKTARILKKHLDYSHSDRKKLVCEQCDFTTPFESSMSTHIMLKHALVKPMLRCKYCTYETPLTGNLRKHIFGAHGLFIITRQHKKLPLYADYEEGTILTKDGQLFDPETMQLPKLLKKTGVKVKEEMKENTGKEGKQPTKISLNRLPVDDFLKEMMKRHEEYMNLPEKKYSFMSSTIAKATEHPSFPQASPQVRNTRANKIYNMKKLKPTFQDHPVEHMPATFGLGNLHGIDQGPVNVGHGGIPQVASEVEVTHDYPPEVVLENVEADPSASTTVLTISEQRGSDGSEMIIINQSGKQTVVRSKDFYDTLAATGHDANQTLGVISALLQAGEQIEIREQEEIVEIQNM